MAYLLEESVLPETDYRREKLLVLCPGQNTQDFIDTEPSRENIEYWGTVDDIIGANLGKVLFENPKNLSKTGMVQVVIVAETIKNFRKYIDLVLDYLQKHEPAIDVENVGVLGNSLGDVSASYIKGVFDLEKALKFAQRREILMQDNIPREDAKIITLEENPFMYLTFNIPRAIIEYACSEANKFNVGYVNISNINADTEYKQIAFTGSTKAAALAYEILKTKLVEHELNEINDYIKKIPSITVPVHTRYMGPAAETLESEIDNYFSLKEPEQIAKSRRSIHWIHTSSDKLVTNRREGLIRVARKIAWPVELCSALGKAFNWGYTHIWEPGPGRGLSTIVKKSKRAFKIIKTETVKESK